MGLGIFYDLEGCEVGRIPQSARPGFSIQPRFEAPPDHWVKTRKHEMVKIR